MDCGIVVDVETTGLDPKADRIIEIGLCEFLWEDGARPTIVSLTGALQDPGVKLSPEIQSITGLSDKLLVGRSINWAEIAKVWERASIIIAHNAAFDRSFLERVPELPGGKHWACSVRHIDWRGKGLQTRKLSYLAAEHGFLNPFAHRAAFDCATTFKLITPYLTEIVTRSYEPEILVKAVQTPFETKDVLKQSGYRWDAEQRFWYKQIFAQDLAAEREFLATQVYRGPSRHLEEEIWFNPKS